MKILIDARLYGPEGSKGLGRYVQQIVEGLKETDKENQYIVLLTKDNWHEFSETENFKKVLAPWRWYTLAEQIYLPRLIKKHRPDLVHFPHFNVPLLYRGEFIVTIHDVLLRRHHSRRASTLGPVKFWLKKRLYLLVVGSAIKRAKTIITVSNFSKNEILNYYKVPAEKIKVIYNGLTKIRQKNSEKSDDKGVVLRYNITKPFILYVGNAYPHKNLEKLVQAFKILREKWSSQLVFVGKEDYFYEQLKKYSRTEISDIEGVKFLGYIPDNDLAALFASANLYVFPSLYEGFGLPPLEAMSQELPVVASDIECLREICGDACQYFDPNDPEDIANKILLVAKDNQLQKELVSKGLEQIKKFNWSEAVRQHLNIYYACK